MKTPRTDKHTFIADRGVHLDTVPAGFARQLERENAEMAALLERFVAMEHLTQECAQFHQAAHEAFALLERINK